MKVVIRAQIPLLIATKNSLLSLRTRSGYSFFINTYLITILLLILFLFGAIYTQKQHIHGYEVLYLLFVIVLLFFTFIVGHVRTAFKMK